MLINVVATKTLKADDRILYQDVVGELVYAPVWDDIRNAWVTTLWFPEYRQHESVELNESSQLIVG